ncbi:MAG TPA: tRNA pseudouridine(38-40) synthase TruA [Fibrobacteria bacterium]|nr:tRNA pseudouridine(38-40) synthase TruA [Fibrobacteria bacterium]
MPRYRFTIEYFGLPFAGWQLQDGPKTIQGTLEEALRTVVRHPVRVHGAGRTDSGVHATGQVAHVDLDEEHEPRRLQHSLNALAAPHIRVRGLERCDDVFHARFDALSRRYLYRIALRPVAMLASLSWHPAWRFDTGVFAAELASAVGRHDFLNFSVPREDGKSTTCHLLRAEVEPAGAFLHVHLEADRFLHKMVRSLVGASFDAARGAHPEYAAGGLVTAILENRFGGERYWAPPHGLSLEKVTYPDGYHAGE